MSLISGTEPGKLTVDRTFLTSIVALVAGPVVGVIVIQFPEIAQLMGEWVQPILRAVK